MRKYAVTLHNQSELLDLRNKKKEIREVLDYLSFGKNEREIKQLKLISIEKKIIQLEVEETNNNWHKRFGKILANNFGMRNFCDPNDQSRLFKWE
jgi:hypothetical protein